MFGVTLELTFENRTSESLRATPCTTLLQRRQADGWERVWSGLSPLGDRIDVDIPAGERRTESVRLGGMLPDDWARPLDGTYRIIVNLRSDREMLPLEPRTSHAFELRASMTWVGD